MAASAMTAANTKCCATYVVREGAVNEVSSCIKSRSPSPDSPPAKRAASADSSGYETDTPDEVQQEAVRRVCGALGMREQFEAAMAAGELLEMLESLPRGAVEASVRLMRGYNRTGEWPEPILTSPAPQRGRSPSPVDEWSDG